MTTTMQRFLSLIVVLFLLSCSTVLADLSGDQIIAKVDNLMSSANFKCLMDITVLRPNQEERTSQIQVLGKGYEKVLVRYLEPARDKGKAYLRVGEDSWFYMPNVNKSLRISGNQSMQGSDLSIDDVMKIKLTDDYTASVIGTDIVDGEDNYLLELSAKRPTVTYHKLKYWVRRADFLPSKFECYTTTGILLKTMTYKDNREISGRYRPIIMEVTSELKKGYKTTLKLLEADYGSENPDRIFTRAYLEKGK